MTDILRNAAARTSGIIAEADMAITLLDGNGRSRQNAVGILADPEIYHMALQQARHAIDRAIMEHQQTTWPTEQDYHAL